MENRILSVDAFADEICSLPRRPSAADFILADVVRSGISPLIAELSVKSGFSTQLIASFLWDCAKRIGNPLSYEWGATPGRVYLVSDPEKFYLG